MVASKTKHVRTLIIGGGITGLSLAYHLEQLGQTDYLLLEAADQLGGLCASTYQKGYTFDFGGHLLHLHTPQGKALIKKLLGNNLKELRRHAFVYTNNYQVPVPFQHNLWALPTDLRKQCVNELQKLPLSATTPTNFKNWCLQSFGYTLYKAFFRPYNEKLWMRRLHKLTADWCAPFIPIPVRKQMIASARSKPTKQLGYNTVFYYPKRGGIGALIKVIAKPLSHIRTRCELTHLDLTQKTAWINKTEKITYDQIVSTIALPSLIARLKGAPQLKKKALLLEAQPITIYHLAIARKVPHFSWIYFPDGDIPFYRIGLQSGFAASCAPGASLLYIELSGSHTPTRALEKQIWQSLCQQGILLEKDVKLFSTWQQIPNAYVIFNKKRAQVVPQLLQSLEKKNCYCAGRYGKWEYSFMERSLTETSALAQKLVKLV